MSFCRAGVNRRSPFRAVRTTIAHRTSAPFSTSAVALAIRSDSTFFNSNNSRHGATLTGQFQGKGLQRWEATLRDAPGARRGFSVSYGSLGEQDMPTLIFWESAHISKSRSAPAHLAIHILPPRIRLPALDVISTLPSTRTAATKSRLRRGQSIHRETRTRIAKPCDCQGDASHDGQARWVRGRMVRDASVTYPPSCPVSYQRY